MTTKTKISIPLELVKKLEEKIKETDFKSVQDYVIYILKQIVSEQEEENNSEKDAYTKEEETDLKKNLEDLGYL